MNTRFVLAACTLASLALVRMPAAAQTPAACAADTPAVAVIRQFLAAHAAGDPQKAYALLSAASQRGVSAQGFAADLPPQYLPPGPNSNPIIGISLLFKDPKNTQHSTYTVLRADPANPALVQVSWTAEGNDFPLTLRLRTVTDPASNAARVDMIGSVEASFPPPLGETRPDKLQNNSERNLSVLAFAIVQYARSHGNRFPDAVHWADDILPAVQDKSLFHAPTAPASQKWSYAYNRNFSRQLLSAVPYPGDVILLYQSTQGVKNASGIGQFLLPPSRLTSYVDVYGDPESVIGFVRNGPDRRFQLDSSK